MVVVRQHIFVMAYFHGCPYNFNRSAPVRITGELKVNVENEKCVNICLYCGIIIYDFNQFVLIKSNGLGLNFKV